MDIAGHRVPTKQIRDVYNFNLSTVSRSSPLTRYITAAHICKSSEIFNKHNISLEDTLSFA
jgi:hypothetical protein